MKQTLKRDCRMGFTPRGEGGAIPVHPHRGIKPFLQLGLKLTALAALFLGATALRAADAPKYGRAADNHIRAQQLVTEIMAANPGLVAAGLHCVPPGGDKQVIIASTLDVIGKPSDPEDILHGGTTIAPSRKA